MCGIVGMLNSRRAPDPELVARMRDALTHRGPDAAGFWRSPDQAAVLSHRRLSIIDLSAAADQPMLSDDAGMALVFNGELYNYRDLRTDLRAEGRIFRTDSDTEVVLQAYRHWGTDCLEHFDGMFAFALYDTEARRLFAARDRAGEKPFYYRRTTDGFSFASELKALLIAPDAPRRLDPGALNHYLAYGNLPGARSILAGYQKLPPGSYLTYDLASGRCGQQPYWSLPAQSLEPVDEADLLDQLEAELDSAIDRQLVADVPVGILLSGGLDSSLLTAVAARRAGGRIKTFNISFPGHGRFDEAPHARLVANHFDTDHHELTARPATVELLHTLAAVYDEPLGDHAIVPMYQLSELVRSEVKVALGGDGGDEIFGGYPHHNWLQKSAPLRRLVPAGLRRGVGAAAARCLPPGYRGRNHLAGFGGSGLGQVNQFFDPLWRHKLLHPALRREADTWDPEVYKDAQTGAETDVLRAACLADFRTTLPDAYLVKVDRASMAHSLEVRAPWLARGVVEFGFGRVPSALKATTSGRKILPRRLATRLLPPELDLNRKQGLTMPLGAWFKDRWGPFLTDVLQGIPGEFMAPGAVAELLHQQSKGRPNTQRIFALAMLELWRRHYKVEW